jgi:hypothetical protein
MSKRKKFNKRDYKNGRIAEKWINKFLKKKKYNFKWLNETKELYLPFDFVIFGKKKKIIAAIEVEWKAPSNKKYFHSGVDYIANKVHENYNKRVPVYYFLVMGDGSEIYKAHMKTLKEKGYFVLKDTIHTRDEEFYRLQLEYINVIDLKEYIK